VSVLASVIGHSRRHGHLLLDAGSLALSADRSAAEHLPDAGHGLVLRMDGAPIPGLRVARLAQEHGIVEAHGPLPFEALPIGSKVRILPGHACITAAMFDAYHVTDDGESVAATWERARGW
jgi:D-serine deaminase-like pyridoxal phosphate-dependent protein